LEGGMTETDNDRVKFYRAFLLLMLVAISAIFFTMIRDFLMTLLLAAIFSGLAYPLYRRLKKKLGDRQVLAAATTILIAILVVVIPLTALLGLIANEAFQISQVVKPWIQEQISQSSGVAERLPAWTQPWIEKLNPFRDQILEKTGEITGMAGNFLFKSLSATTRGTVSFFLHLFVMLYAMFFFLMDGPVLIQKVRSYLPLRESDKDLMEERFMSVTRATIKGTFAIGAIQGLLGGLGFAVAGIQGSIFWAALMGVLSVIPGVGAAIIWAPVVIYLLATGDIFAGVALLAWCAGVVGTVDNVLRPRLVGKDAKMPDLLILLSTLGGIVMFGAVGFIIGPIVAALFLTIWDMYGAAFQDVLQPGTYPSGPEGDSEAPL
jgi:predicted PurR-regulated permease PerM